MLEELSNVSTGDVIVGNHVEKSKIFNELNIPVVCEGVKNLLVAASPDGILVCGVDHRENIKGLVEQIQNRPMYQERRWGSTVCLIIPRLPMVLNHSQRTFV